MDHLLSSPEEKYIEHIKKVGEQFNIIYPLFESALSRVLSLKEDLVLKDALNKMIIFHDIGKLTKRWQDRVGKNEKLPAHAPIGAAYLYKILPKELKEPVSFAVAIHHSDKGLLGDNIEKPDAQAINDLIIDYSTNKIIWDKRVEKLDDKYFPDEIKNLDIVDLKDMARGLRVWSRGCNLIEQHTRRMQMSLVHHILKLCDISAASERKEFRKEPDNPFGGWLMSIKITRYVKRIKARIKDG